MIERDSRGLKNYFTKRRIEWSLFLFFLLIAIIKLGEWYFKHCLEGTTTKIAILTPVPSLYENLEKGNVIILSIQDYIKHLENHKELLEIYNNLNNLRMERIENSKKNENKDLIISTKKQGNNIYSTVKHIFSIYRFSIDFNFSFQVFGRWRNLYRSQIWNPP